MKLAVFIKNYLLIIVALTFSCLSFGQIFNPEIENYSIENYKASNQNWGIDVNEEGVVFVANNKGLLKYNGQTWQLYEIPNKTIVRSVLCVRDKIYTGSYEEFGYWNKNNLGEYIILVLPSRLMGGKPWTNDFLIIFCWVDYNQNGVWEKKQLIRNSTSENFFLFIPKEFKRFEKVNKKISMTF